jgi:hypothetical protein
MIRKAILQDARQWTFLSRSEIFMFLLKMIGW